MSYKIERIRDPRQPPSEAGRWVKLTCGQAGHEVVCAYDQPYHVNLHEARVELAKLTGLASDEGTSSRAVDEQPEAWVPKTRRVDPRPKATLSIYFERSCRSSLSEDDLQTRALNVVRKALREEFGPGGGIETCVARRGAS